MSFTVQNVIDEAAVYSAGLVITPPNGLLWTKDAVNLIMARRTDTMFDENGAIQEVPTLDEATDTIPLDVRFQTNLARYVAAKQFFTDAENAKHREQAVQMLQLSGLGGPV